MPLASVLGNIDIRSTLPKDVSNSFHNLCLVLSIIYIIDTRQ